MPAGSPSPTTFPRTLATAGLPRRVRKVLEQALALVSAELDPQLGTMLNEFEQELFRLADTSRNAAAQGDYMHALRTLRLNRADLIPRFMLELEAGLSAIRQPQVQAAVTVSGEQRVNFRNMALVEDAAMDEGTVLAEIASRVEGRATLPLHLLGQRFGVLAGSPGMDAEHLPLGPRALCRAMRDASQTLQVSFESHLLLYRIFERHVLASYAHTLEALDAAIAEAGVLPGLTFVPLRMRATAQDGDKPADATAAASPKRAEGAADATANTNGAPGAPTASEGGAAVGGASDTASRTAPGGNAAAQGTRPTVSSTTSSANASTSALARNANATAMSRNDPQRPHTAWMGESGGATDEDEDSSLAALQQLISGRRELIGKLRPSREPATGGPRDQLSTRDVSSALGQLQALPPSAAGATRSLQDIKQALLAQARQQRGRGATLSQKDSDTFELLNMLYGQIESEIRPDAPGAALLRRLQLPLLRVALHDRAFFVRGKHPARVLLNVVAESAAKWLGEEDFDPQMLAPLQQAVSHVVDNYDGDDAVFAASNVQLEQHLQAQVRKAEMLERRHVEAARGKEKLEVAKRRAAETLTTLIGDQRLAKFVRALLNQAWADVLTLTLLRQGEHSDEWRQQVDVTRQIIAACGRGGALADPSLRTHIEAALAQVGYHAEEAEVIAQRLTSTDSEDENDAASRTELAVKLKARARLGEDAAKAGRIKLPPRTGDEQARYEQLRVLPFGTWIEFVTNQQGDVVRRRLSWFSPVTDNALFVNQRGQRIGEQSLDSLARMLAANQARIVTAERARLVDRAWQAAVSALRSFAGRNDEPAAAEQPT